MNAANLLWIPDSEAATPPEQLVLLCVLCANATLLGDDFYIGQTNWTLWSADRTELTLQECAEAGEAYEDYVVDDEEESGKIISDSLRKVFETVNYSIISGIISVLGSVANIINIAVFCRQRFADSVNISLLGLAVSDLGALLTLVWMSVCFCPLFQDLELSFDPVDVQYLTAGWPHVCFARITSYITAYVTLERCLCVTVPLKVKTIITPRRTTVTIILIFLVLFASVAPVYFSIHLGPVNTTTTTFLSNSHTGMAVSSDGFVDAQNQTADSATCTVAYVSKVNITSSLIGLVYADNGARLENISFSIGVFAQISSFIAVIICTVILVRKLAQTSRWRARTAASSKPTEATASTMSQRDKRLVKMVTFLSTIFIICFLPSAVNLIIMISSSEYSIVGKYRNMFQVGWSFLNCLEATNSSVNILVYYKMSSRYRKCFREMFGLDNKDTVYASKSNGERSVSRT